MPGGKCPRDVAEDFLGAVFVQHGYVSLLVGPWAWAAYVILLGMTRVPKHDETSCSSQILSFFWLVSQSVAIMFLFAAFVMPIFGYLKFMQDFSPCAGFSVSLGVAWILTMPSLGKIGPLVLAVGATVRFADQQPRYKACLARTLVVIGKFIIGMIILLPYIIIVLAAKLREMSGLPLRVALLLLSPLFVSIACIMLTLLVLFFPLVCVGGVSLLLMLTLASLAAGTQCMNMVEKAFGFSVTRLHLHVLKVWPRSFVELGDYTRDLLHLSDVFLLLMACSVALVWVILVFGCILTDRVVSLSMLLSIVHDIYAYVFDFDQVVLEVPDFLATLSALENLDALAALQVIADLGTFWDLPSADILVRSRELAGFSSVLLLLRTIVQSAFFAVHFLTGGRLGVEGVAVMPELVVDQHEVSDVKQDEESQATHVAQGEDGHTAHVAQGDDSQAEDQSLGEVIGNSRLLSV